MLRRRIEFCALYLGVPVLLVVLQNRGIKVPIMPALILFALAMLPVLRRDKEFRFAEFVRVRTVPRREWLLMAAWFVLNALLLTVALRYVMPEAMLKFPRENPRFWALVMLCYPIFSVLAQSVVYRALYWSRYSRMFPEKYKIPIGAAVFAFAHLPYANAYALAFPFVGGLMFLSGYRRTRSLLFANVAHALYGDFLFTIGWGQFFFHAGIMRMLENMQ